MRYILVIALFITQIILSPMAYPGQEEKVVFIISQLQSKVMAEAMAKFWQEHSQLKKEVNIAVYSFSHYPSYTKGVKDEITPPDLSDADYVFIEDPKAIGLFKEDIDKAMSKGAKIIGIGQTGKMALSFQGPGYYTVDINIHPWISKYQQYSGFENKKRLIVYLLSKFCNISGIEPEPPAETLAAGMYHPDAPGLFTSLEEYLTWYKKSGRFKKGQPIVGVIPYMTYMISTGQTAIEEEIIKELERNNLNVISPVGCSDGSMDSMERLQKYLLKNGKPQVDVLVVLGLTHPPRDIDQALEIFQKLNIPLIKGVILYGELKKWRESTQGISVSDSVSRVLYPELSGLIEPIVVGGTKIYIDKKTGIKITEMTPEEERVKKLVSRVKSWCKLRRLPNNQKKVAIIYYNHGAAKDDIGCSQLDIFRSLQNVIDAMKETGYHLGEEVSLSKEELKDMLLRQGRNIGTPEPGELKKLIAPSKITLIPVEKYKKWFKELPEHFQNRVEETWGDVDKTTLMTWRDKETRVKYIVIPGVIYGNIFLGPQPARGGFDESEAIYHSLTLPPHHQYVAFYLWLKHEFKADSVIHFGTHGTLEWLPGKSLGLSKNCCPDVLIQDIPDIYPYILDNIGEGIQAKRRGAAVIIDHMYNAINTAGLYKEYAELNELFHQYTLTKAQSPLAAAEYKKEILKLATKLDIGHDLGIDLDKIEFEDIMEELHDYLHELKAHNIPYGLHVFGASPVGEALLGMVRTMISVETDIPPIQEIVSRIVKLDYEKIKKHPGRYSKDVDRIDAFCQELFKKVIVEKVRLEEIGKEVFGKDYVNTSNGNKQLLIKALKMSLKHARNLGRCDEEIKNTLRALNGEYIMPGPGGDPIRTPDAIPTGRNFFSFDPTKMPSRAVYKVGKKLAEDLIKEHLEKNGRYPHKIGLTLTAFQACLHHGVTESQVLALLGTRPVWDERGKIIGVELIPEEELKRPRIDVFLNPSGLHRDLFPMWLEMIDGAVQLAISAEKEKYENFAKLHTLEIKEALKAKGYSEEEAEISSRFRIFGPPPEGYGTGVDKAVYASGTWEKEDKIAELFLMRRQFAYGKNAWGKSDKEALKETLKGMDLIVSAITSNAIQLLGRSGDDRVQYDGGLALAVRYVSGKTPKMYINDLRDPSNAKTVSFAKFAGLEMRACYLNPKWIEEMKKYDYSGARRMREWVMNLWGWQVVTPDEITKKMWEQAYEVYVKDKHDLKLKEFFNEHSPHAYQELIAHILEAERKGYQKFDKAMLQDLVKEYVESIAEFGLPCSDMTCGNIKLNEFAAKILVPLSVDVKTVHKFQEQVKRAMELPIKTPDWVKDAQEKEKEAGAGTAPGKVKDEAGSKKLEDVKGYEMKEKKDETATDLPTSGVSLVAILIVLGIVAVIGRGLWKGMRR